MFSIANVGVKLLSCHCYKAHSKKTVGTTKRKINFEINQKVNDQFRPSEEVTNILSN
jgi:hypothetical protein